MAKNKWEKIFGISEAEAAELQAQADERDETKWEEIEREWVK